MTLPGVFLTGPIAHRALHDAAAGRPENGLSALRAAVAAGYGAELDLQLSSDGVPMVFHDYTLDRLTPETGPVNTRSAAELGAIRLTGSEDTIPTLAEALAEVAGRVPLLLEFKEQSQVMGPVDGALERAVAELLAGYDGPVAVMSFSPYALAAFQKVAPQVPLGMTTGSYDDPEWAPLGEDRLARFRSLQDAQDLGACFISQYHKDLGDPRVAALKAKGLPILCWTIRSHEEEAEARKIADTITFEGYRPA
ncbi:glycerophosphodiester phosphodiesterase family protein [Nioella nitratireducens]|uniref:glycerophosphodiester phosphodiesterase family protein n=1 Tax=Nioella nitratireducens TaxID=1287720 RepID=UPI0008FD597E|nr:glycerophosphodiester phosphodiesterase family protein [Nioella nitratireducens]